MTRLEAVNVMLQSIQESSVNTLESGIVDAETAEGILEETKKKVLEKGWSVNSDYNFKITRDVNNKINVPTTALRIDASDPQQAVRVPTNSVQYDLVPRNDSGTRRMWDREKQTFIFTTDIYFDIVSDLAFDDLPNAYQTYITLSAAERFQTRVLGSAVLDRFLKSEKAEAWSAMLDAEADQQDNNILRDSESVRWLAWRNNRRSLA